MKNYKSMISITLLVLILKSIEKRIFLISNRFTRFMIKNMNVFLLMAIDPHISLGKCFLIILAGGRL